ncbi:hypothetical protein P692DRAFT_20398454 [Suillus brevipes Sb2]|nr:hypothetical protein P692DRAFT_20398454 [Suillus brevipes Sb2]
MHRKREKSNIWDQLGTNGKFLSPSFISGNLHHVSVFTVPLAAVTCVIAGLYAHNGYRNETKPQPQCQRSSYRSFDHTGWLLESETLVLAFEWHFQILGDGGIVPMTCSWSSKILLLVLAQVERAMVRYRRR